MNTKSTEQIAIDLGYEFAKTHEYMEAPLSYEYADMITSQEIYRQVESENIHPIPDGDYEFILDDWEKGYEQYWEEQN